MANDALDKYFSIIALFILFRETVEASIIVSVLLQFLSRTFPHLRKQVWWGVFFGVSTSIIFGIIFSAVYYTAKQNIFTGKNQSIFKGSIAWFAGSLITVLAFAMLRYKGWEDKIKRKLEMKAAKELARQRGELPSDDVESPSRLRRVKQRAVACMSTASRPVVTCASSCWATTSTSADKCWGTTTGCVAPCWRTTISKLSCGLLGKEDGGKEPVSELVGENEDLVVTKGQGSGLFLLVFSTVLREGIESVVFLAGVGNAQPSSLPLPGLVGLICGVLAGSTLYYSGKQVKDIKYFIIIMSVVLFFIAGGQFMVGTDYLITGGMFGYCSPWVNDRPWTMQPLWDFSGCCSDNAKFFSLVRAIFGYQDKPTFIEIIVYTSYWCVVFMCAAYKMQKGSLFDADFKYKLEMAREAKNKAKQEQELALQLKLAGTPKEAEVVASKLAPADTAASELQDPCGRGSCDDDSSGASLQQAPMHGQDASVGLAVAGTQVHAPSAGLGAPMSQNAQR